MVFFHDDRIQLEDIVAGISSWGKCEMIISSEGKVNMFCVIAPNIPFEVSKVERVDWFEERQALKVNRNSCFSCSAFEFPRIFGFVRDSCLSSSRIAVDLNCLYSILQDASLAFIVWALDDENIQENVKEEILAFFLLPIKKKSKEWTLKYLSLSKVAVSYLYRRALMFMGEKIKSERKIIVQDDHFQFRSSEYFNKYKELNWNLLKM